MMTKDEIASDHPPSPIRLFVDELDQRQAGGMARVLRGEEVLALPIAFLPAGAREGDWIELSVRILPPPPDGAEGRRKRLVAGDPGGPIKL